jgi:hypothetical protein
MPKKIDPLNKKIYGLLTAVLTVTDVKAAAAFIKRHSVLPNGES